MKVSELCNAVQGKLKTTFGADAEIQCGLVCDLLSFVMARGASGCAWVTVQTHLNVIAIASLHEMACIIVPEGMTTEQFSVDKADEESVAIIETPLSAYAVCGIMHDLHIKPAEQ
ncbi:MAG: AraC family transcriptional regulator [Clostridia bacterium]